MYGQNGCKMLRGGGGEEEMLTMCLTRILMLQLGRTAQMEPDTTTKDSIKVSKNLENMARCQFEPKNLERRALDPKNDFLRFLRNPKRGTEIMRKHSIEKVHCASVAQEPFMALFGLSCLIF